MSFRPDDVVKSCPRLESGLRLGPDGIRACVLGAFAAPLYWSAEEAAGTRITKEMIIEKRKWLFNMLNGQTGGEGADFDCQHCQMVCTKRFADVDFTRVGQIDLAATTICNLRCTFCGFTRRDLFIQSKYDDLAILKEFSAEDAEWDSVVDFNGGEPTLLANLNEYLEYFVSRRIRVRFMTNGVRFHPLVARGLVNGTIQWVCTSVDAGTPSTYLRIKKRDCYLQVLENLTRYAHAGSQGGGRLALKYIFCNENCSDDDISGFAYAMLAIRPHQVWLTFDFSALASKQADTEDLGDYDFAKDIAAYARMYHVLKKHGVHAVHYTVGHLARVSVQGKILLERVLKEIEATEPHGPFPDLRLENFRESERNEPADQATFHISPLRLERPNGEGTRWSLENKRVLLAPACSQSIALASDPEIRKGRLLGFLDRDRTVQGKSINGLKVHGYGSITDLAPDAILVAAPGQHESEIVRTINRHTGRHMQVAVLGRVGSL